MAVPRATSKPRQVRVPEFDARGVFAAYRDKVYYRYAVGMHVDILAGGIPSDPNVAEGWLRTKLGLSKDQLVQEQVAAVMLERGIDASEATKAVTEMKHLNGFKRDTTTDLAVRARREAQEPLLAGLKKAEAALAATTDATTLKELETEVADLKAKLDAASRIGELYIEGRQAKAMLKEACSIAADLSLLQPRGYGNNSKKGLLSFFAETGFIEESTLYLGVTAPDGINQRFVHTYRGSGIQYEEFVRNVNLELTVMSAHDYTEDEWAAMWVLAERNGIGASRSQGNGTFTVTRWQRLAGGPTHRVGRRKTADSDGEG
jgi:hypothetical protein